MPAANSLVVAFFYESFSLYRKRGYSFEDCVEFDKDETIDAIAKSIQANGYHVMPVGDNSPVARTHTASGVIKELVQRVANSDHEQWDIAFSISEGMYGVGREAQVPGLLEAYQIPHVFSDAATLALCLDKGKTKMILEQLGIPTAPFAVVPALWTKDDGPVADILLKSSHAEELKTFPLFIKPACEGSSKGIYPFSKVNNPAELEDGVQKLQIRFPGQSVLIETYLAGREYTVSILGTGSSARAIGTINLDWEALRNEKEQSNPEPTRSANPFHGGFFDVSNKNEHGKDELHRMVDGHDDPEAQAAECLALQAWRALECCDVGRVDVRYSEDGKPYVLELNPLPGLRPRWSALAETALDHGVSHEVLIGKVFDSALERYPHLKESHREGQARIVIVEEN